MIKILEGHVFTIIGAVIILLIGLIIGLIVKKTLRKVLHEFELDKMVNKFGKNYSLERRLSSLAAYLIYFIVFVIFLNHLGITSVILYLIVGVILLLLVITFILGFRDFIPNFIAGILLYHKGKMKKGKKIKFNGIEGKICKLGMLELEIETKKGDIIYLPNSLLIKSKVWLLR